MELPKSDILPISRSCPLTDSRNRRILLHFNSLWTISDACRARTPSTTSWSNWLRRRQFDSWCVPRYDSRSPDSEFSVTREIRAIFALFNPRFVSASVIPKSWRIFGWCDSHGCFMTHTSMKACLIANEDVDSRLLMITADLSEERLNSLTATVPHLPWAISTFALYVTSPHPPFPKNPVKDLSPKKTCFDVGINGTSVA